jgi:hypothetical protein
MTPQGMHTNRSIPASADHWASDGGTPPKQGFTDPRACVTMKGYGYTSRAAAKCPVGTYNPEGSMSPCKRCPLGRSTADDADQQGSEDDCKLAPGYGFHDNAIVPCPVGEWPACVGAECVATTTRMMFWLLVGARSIQLPYPCCHCMLCILRGGVLPSSWSHRSKPVSTGCIS